LSSAPKPACVDITGWIVTGKLAGAAMRGALSGAAAARTAPVEEVCSARAAMPGLRTCPIRARPDVHRAAEAFHLRRRHQPGVIVLVAGERQAEALDGVGR
jgi:hypothetical protein